jgi:hypothetical protein
MFNVYKCIWGEKEKASSPDTTASHVSNTAFFQVNEGTWAPWNP